MGALLQTPAESVLRVNLIRIAMCHLCLVHTGVLPPTPAENARPANLNLHLPEDPAELIIPIAEGAPVMMKTLEII